MKWDSTIRLLCCHSNLLFIRTGCMCISTPMKWAVSKYTDRMYRHLLYYHSDLHSKPRQQIFLLARFFNYFIYYEVQIKIDGCSLLNQDSTAVLYIMCHLCRSYMQSNLNVLLAFWQGFLIINCHLVNITYLKKAVSVEYKAVFVV